MKLNQTSKITNSSNKNKKSLKKTLKKTTKICSPSKLNST